VRELTLDGLLDAFAARTPAPGGGAGAGVAAALGAALAEMGARFAGLEEDARRAAELRALALELAEGDAAGYAPVLEAVRLPRDVPGRAERVQAALAAAADVPLGIAEAAAEAAALARRVAAAGRPALAGDAWAGAELAAAAARAAARLVAIDLEHAPDDPRRARAEAAAAGAGAA
jgi:formiminotetrahydrofolate cyclodeaminase